MSVYTETEQAFILQILLTTYRVHHWDVNNEMLHGEFYVDKLNDSTIREWMFHKVRELDSNVTLFLNEYEVVASGLYTQVCKC